MGDGYGKLFLLLTAIAVIFLAASGKGKQVYQVLMGRGPSQTGAPAPKNPTDFSGGMRT